VHRERVQGYPSPTQLSRYFTSGRWGAPKAFPEALRQAGQWSPVLHCDAFGRLWLFYAETAAHCLRKPISRPGRALVPQVVALSPQPRMRG
jgi:hypothetical protein